LCSTTGAFASMLRTSMLRASKVFLD